MIDLSRMKRMVELLEESRLAMERSKVLSIRLEEELKSVIKIYEEAVLGNEKGKSI